MKSSNVLFQLVFNSFGMANLNKFRSKKMSSVAWTHSAIIMFNAIYFMTVPHTIPHTYR
jgi:hypothetical protein